MKTKWLLFSFVNLHACCVTYNRWATL